MHSSNGASPQASTSSSSSSEDSTPTVLQYKPLSGGQMFWARLRMALAAPRRRVPKGSYLVIRLEGAICVLRWWLRVFGAGVSHSSHPAQAAIALWTGVVSRTLHGVGFISPQSHTDSSSACCLGFPTPAAARNACHAMQHNKRSMHNACRNLTGPQTLQSRFSEFAAHCTLIHKRLTALL